MAVHSYELSEDVIRNLVMNYDDSYSKVGVL